MPNVKPLTIKKYVVPLDGIVRSTAEQTLGSVMSNVQSSHDAVFIFDDSETFLGLVSPFLALYSRNFPYTTKMATIAVQPPRITEAEPLYRVAKYMLATKIYTLPVFSKAGELKGVINARDILKNIPKNASLLRFVSENIKRHTPVTASLGASAKDVFYTLREKGVSRMVLTDAEDTLSGIVTRGDLMHALIKPTPKMRFAGEGSRAGRYSLAGEKKFRKNEPVGTFATRMVDSLSEGTPKMEIVTHLLTSPHNSVVLVDAHHRPTGFLSSRDVLKTLVLLRPVETVPLSIKKPSKAVSNAELQRATEHLELFGKKLQKRMKISKIEVTSKEPQSPQNNTKMFNTTVIVTPVSGKTLVAVTKHAQFIDGIQQATKVIEKQRRRTKSTRPTNKKR